MTPILIIEPYTIEKLVFVKLGIMMIGCRLCAKVVLLELPTVRTVFIILRICLLMLDVALCSMDVSVVLMDTCL